MTRKRVVTTVILIWVQCVSFPFILLVSSKKLAIMVVSTILGFCFIITAVVYCRIYFTVRNHRNQIQIQQIQVAQNSQIESAARQRKSAASILYVYLVFLVCNLPEYCLGAAHFISPPSTALYGLFLYSGTLVYVNSSLNPIIYGWKMRHIRHAMIDTL